jgi:hypothetical protein
MANEFIARNGLISQNNSAITGSLTQGAAGNITSGSYSHAEGIGLITNTSLTINVNDGSVTYILFGPIGGTPVYLGNSILILSGDQTGILPTIPYTLSNLYLEALSTDFYVNLEYFSPTPRVTDATYDGDNDETTFTFDPPLKTTYHPVDGAGNKALGAGSHAEGFSTTAKGDFQHVQGQYNITSSVQSAFIHGNGTSWNSRSNLIYAHDSVVEVTGSLNISGSLLVNGVAPGGGGSGAGFPYSGSAVITGSLLVSGSTTITGSLEVSGSITGSLFGTASFARYPFITITTVGATAAGSSPNTDYIYLVNGSHTVTLPDAIGNTSRYDIKNIGTGIATIATTSAQTIDTTTASITIPVRYTSLTIVSNGTNWNII